MFASVRQSSQQPEQLAEQTVAGSQDLHMTASQDATNQLLDLNKP